MYVHYGNTAILLIYIISGFFEFSSILILQKRKKEEKTTQACLDPDGFPDPSTNIAICFLYTKFKHQLYFIISNNAELAYSRQVT